MGLVIIFGQSGAGKDYTAKKFFSGHKIIKFTAPVKRAMELEFDLPESICDRTKDRERFVITKPGCYCGLTVSEALAASFEEAMVSGVGWGAQWRGRLPSLAADEVERFYLHGLTDFIFTDARIDLEVKVIVQSSRASGLSIEAWQLSKDFGGVKAADRYLAANIQLYEQLTGLKVKPL